MGKAFRQSAQNRESLPVRWLESSVNCTDPVFRCTNAYRPSGLNLQYFVASHNDPSELKHYDAFSNCHFNDLYRIRVLNAADAIDRLR